MNEAEIQNLAKAVKELSPVFYSQPEFWISTVIGVAGVLLGIASIVYSIKAYREASAAKHAATEAGKTVKIQTITIELTEITQRLDKLNYELSFSEARDLLNEISRRLRRLIAPFQDTDGLSEPCTTLKGALDEAKMALDEVRPQSSELELAPNAVYFATEGHFSNISSIVAEIMGLFEKRTIEVSE